VHEKFDGHDANFKSIDERFDAINKRFDSVDEELRAIRNELSHINRRLDLLEEQVGGMKGFSKEIDELRDRIKSIEKHVGLKTI
jgi:predicted  nucleic acid-binding Zn-ribbon protein